MRVDGVGLGDALELVVERGALRGSLGRKVRQAAIERHRGGQAAARGRGVVAAARALPIFPGGAGLELLDLGEDGSPMQP